MEETVQNVFDKLPKAHKLVKIPVVDIFGPVIQGEGAMIGRQTSFIRTGGCDYRCSKCDTMYAVDPEQVKKNSTWMTPDEIVDKVCLDQNNKKAPWVTLSGGNPAMWNFDDVITRLQTYGYRIAIETQGSLWKTWIAKCDQITVSPKGPGMIEDTEGVIQEVKAFMAHFDGHLTKQVCIKIPVFAHNDSRKRDIAFAIRISQLAECRGFPLYLSLGNYYVPEQYDAKHITQSWMNDQRMADYRALAEVISDTPELRDAVFLPQLHVLAYGNERAR